MTAKSRQICDLGLRSLVKKIGDISEAQWEFQEMFPLQLIPTFVLLHQVSCLEWEEHDSSHNFNLIT